MASQNDFKKLLSNIEPSNSTVQYISSIHNNLRDYLLNLCDNKEHYVDSFLSGSYAKHTSIRPAKDDSKRDVDIIIVTDYRESDNSRDVIYELRDVLKKSKKYETASVQRCSIGVLMEGISIDVVPVIACTFDEDLYYIGDSVSGEWRLTDPKGHKAWSTKINQENEEKYKPIVKIMKWWRRNNCPTSIKYPKGIVLEKIIADNLGDPSTTLEEMLIETMGNMVTSYESYTKNGFLPVICDPSNKIHGNNLLDGYKFEDFCSFIRRITDHINLLNDEGTENETWRKILGDEFPKEINKKSDTNRLVCENANHRQKMSWPCQRDGFAFITLEVKDSLGNEIIYENNGNLLDKNCSLCFKAYTGVKTPYTVKWQVTNTGKEAIEAGCLRGNFEDSNGSFNEKRETTLYSGNHSIQCFIIKNGICVAKSKIFIINVK